MANEHLTVRESPIEVGMEAPDFTLPDQDQSDWTLSAELRQGDVCLCFYPMDFSPVCSTEMGCITSDLAKFEAQGVEVVGISCDSFFVHKAYADAMGLRHTLLADMHRTVCRAYGFYFAPLNVAARGTVLVGSDGRVKWVQARELGDAMRVEEILAVR